MSLHQEDYANIGINLLPFVIEAVKAAKEIMDREGLDIDGAIALLESKRDILPELDFGEKG